MTSHANLAVLWGDSGVKLHYDTSVTKVLHISFFALSFPDSSTHSQKKPHKFTVHVKKI